MIPTLILLGLVLGRWWQGVLAVAAVVWPTALLIDGATGLEPALLAAAVLAVLNAGVGVLVNRGVAAALRRGSHEEPADR